MAHYFRFGRFEVHPAERELLKDGAALTIGARAFDILHVLIEGRDRTISKAELLELVWPGLYVEENNVQVQISTLRKLLGAQSILTLPGRGYRFAITVETFQGTDATPAAKAAVPATATTLPAPPRRMVGRDKDLAELLTLLQQDSVISIVGAMGVGKSTLALMAAHTAQDFFPDGIAWLDLSLTRALHALPDMIATALNLAAPDSTLDDPLHSMQELHALVVLDNAEHMLDPIADLVWQLQQRAPGVHLLITSQAALKVDNERIFRLQGLSIPPSGVSVEEAIRHGAIRLFQDQAQAVDRTFRLNPDNVSTVISLCRQLDGMALAIKYAAERLPMFGLMGVHSQLNESLKILSVVRRGGSYGDGAIRQTLYAALDWSYSLLSPYEQIVFRRCAIFFGGGSLNLICEVCRDATMDSWDIINALEGLVDRSLIDVMSGQTLRYRLSDYAYEYARLKLADASELEILQARHAQAITQRVEDAYERYWHTADTPWLESIAVEIDNIRVALDRYIQKKSELAPRILASSAPIFLLLGRASEIRRYFMAAELNIKVIDPARKINALPGDEQRHLARYWLERSRLFGELPNVDCYSSAMRAIELYRSSDDQPGLFLALNCAVEYARLPTQNILILLNEINDLENKRWPPRLRSQRLLAEISANLRFDRIEDACLALDALQLLAHTAGLAYVEMETMYRQASLKLSLGALDKALSLSRSITSHFNHVLNDFSLHALAITTTVLLFQNEAASARHSLSEFIKESKHHGWELFDFYADLLAMLAAVEGRFNDAARLIGYADASYPMLGGRDFRGVQNRIKAKNMVAEELSDDMIATLIAEGSKLDRESACLLALKDNLLTHAP